MSWLHHVLNNFKGNEGQLDFVLLFGRWTPKSLSKTSKATSEHVLQQVILALSLTEHALVFSLLTLLLFFCGNQIRGGKNIPQKAEHTCVIEPLENIYPTPVTALTEMALRQLCERVPHHIGMGVFP